MFRRDSPDGDDVEAQRAALVDRLVETGRIEREATAEAMRAVPRHEFVPESRRDAAYADRPLPIGADQTVSAPHMVGIMCDHLALEPGDEILEIGTGCGYHAAVTTDIVGDGNVYSVEYVDRLAREARGRLADLSHDVHVRVGDGHEGWPEHAPYDAAYLTCAAASVPDPVVDQLRAGGRLVAPIGTNSQRLVTVTKTPTGTEREEHGAVRFVTMQGGES